jgi:nitrous oxidase accessory protein NosD
MLVKPIKGVVSTILTDKGEQVLVLKGKGQGVWDAKFAKLDEPINEGNAFGMAVTAAKKEGKSEFEFNGKTYKVKKGSYEKNEAAKKLAEKAAASVK